MKSKIIRKYFFSIIWLVCVVVLPHTSNAAASQYSYSVTVGADGKPVLAVTNLESSASITGIAFTVDLSNGASLGEFRRYYDSVMDDLHDPSIAPGHTAKISFGYVVGSDISKLSPQIQAVIFDDGSTEGQLQWINMMITRRQRLLARMSSIRDTLNVSGAASQDPTLDLARVKAQVDATLPDDDLRIVDDLALDSVITTLRAGRAHGFKRGPAEYQHLMERRISRLNATVAGSLRNAHEFRLAESAPAPFQDHRLALQKGNTEASGTALKAVALKLRSGGSFSIIGRPLILADIHQCGINSHSETLVIQLSGCGPSNKYDLSVSILNYDSTTGQRTYSTYDSGNYNAYGSCWQSYTDCNGGSHSGGSDRGLANFQSGDDGTTTRFWWNVDDWSAPGSSACSCGDPNPDGINFSAPVNNRYVPGLFYFADQSTSSCVVQ